MNQKIMQITAIPGSEDNHPIIYALTENGEIWFKVMRTYPTGWKKEDIKLQSDIDAGAQQ